MVFRPFYLVLLSLIFLGACTSSGPFYSREGKRWNVNAPQIPEGEIAFTVFLVGDAGDAVSDPFSPCLAALQSELHQAGSNSAIVFLGDNLYPDGLPAPGDPGRQEAESHLLAQLDLLKGFRGQSFFIPGNHDWEGGKPALLRQMAYIDSIWGDEQHFFPREGCGDPQAIPLTDNLTLLLIDSQWWLQDWEKEPDINKGCKVHSREEFLNSLKELIDKYDDTHLLLCMHHPLYSTGIHGGYAPLDEHLFPLRRIHPALYLPLPVLGSLYPTARYLGVSAQDLTHRKNLAFQQAILETIHRLDGAVVASGHEHVLEYFSYPKENQHFIVSGSGSKSGFAKAVKDDYKAVSTDFLYREQGFARIIYLVDGSAWLEFLAAEGEGAKSRVLYRKQISQAQFALTERIVAGDPEMKEPEPGTIPVVASMNYQAGPFKRLWLGRQYRDAWAAKVPLPALDLSTHKGGLVPTRQGGGRSSKNLRLEGMDGQEYVLRSLEKNASSFLPISAHNTLLEKAVQDQFSMGHPYGAMLVPPLADAAGVFHTNPEFFFVPPQKNLGYFSQSFGNHPYLFEERPSQNWENLESFGNAKKIVSYRRLLRELREDPDHQVDQPFTLRTRLFDMWINDFDRHDDQFRWARFKEGDFTVYRPIPRDRDMAFLRFEGILPWMLSHSPALARELKSFTPKIQDIVGLNKSASAFDRSFLNQMTLEDWEKTARYLQFALNDEVIEAAVRSWPDTLYRLDGAEFTRNLKSRREGLLKAAQKYYRFLAKEVDVTGTDKRDEFVVERLNKQETLVQVFALDKEGNRRWKYYERRFFQKETQEIRLFGLGSEDRFLVRGKASRGPLLRIIGGEGADTVRDESSVGKMGKQTKVYDTPLEENHLQLGREGKDLCSTQWDVNEYDRKSFRHPLNTTIVRPGLNPDDGFILRLGISMIRYGFRKYPFKSRQFAGFSFAFATQAVNIRYRGEFVQLFGKWDLGVFAHWFGESHVQNFFGLGNESPYPNAAKENYDFNRIRYRQFRVNPLLIRPFNNREHAFYLGVGVERTLASRDEGRISDNDFDGLSGLSDKDFQPKTYGSFTAGYRIEKTDHPYKPKRGILFNADFSWNQNLDSLAMSFARIKSSLAFYYTIEAIRTTLASRFGASVNLGDYEFFQANFLGRRDNLRGYRGERFGGDAIYFQNTDLRIDLFRTKNFLIPMVLGVAGFFDYGRVWHKEDSGSTAWHSSYGGGIHLQVFDHIVVNVFEAISPESRFFEIDLGFFF